MSAKQISTFDEAHENCIERLTQLLKEHNVPSPVASSVISLYSEVRTKSCIAFHLLGAYHECQDFIANDPILH